jgi:type IV fimbrial biogenesis protein FimT
MMCTVAITAVLSGGALPMFKDLRADQLLRATADQLETDIQYARSIAVTSSSTLRLEVSNSASAGSCYVIHDGGDHACTCSPGLPARCDEGVHLLRQVDLPAANGISLTAPARSIVFSPGKGTISPTATLRLQDGDGRNIHQVVNIVGRVRSCTQGGKVSGLKAC